MRKQLGIASILTIVFVFSLLSAAWYLSTHKSEGSTFEFNFDFIKNIKIDIPFFAKKSTFDPLPKAVGVPEMINDDAIYEIDNMFDDVDKNTFGEDLSDLEL